MTREEYLIEETARRDQIKANAHNKIAMCHKLQDAYPKTKITYHMTKMGNFPREYVQVEKHNRTGRINCDGYNNDKVTECILQYITKNDCELLFEEE